MTAFLLRRLRDTLWIVCINVATFAIPPDLTVTVRRRSRRLPPDSELTFFNRLQQFRFKTEMADIGGRDNHALFTV